MTPPSLVFLDYSGSVFDEHAKAWLLTALTQSPDNRIVVVVPRPDTMLFMELALDTFESVETVLKTIYGRGGDPDFVQLVDRALNHPDLSVDVSHIIFCTDLYIAPFERPNVASDIRFEFVTAIENSHSPQTYKNCYQWVEQFATLTQTIAPQELDNTLDHLRAVAQRKIIDQSVGSSLKSQLARKM